MKDLNKKIFYMNTYGHVQNDNYDVSNISVNYFGDSTVNHKSFDVCFGYIYDNNTNNYYYIEPQCGGSNQDSAYAYINKYTVKDDEANNFRINESNYKEFSEYKYTFKKDNKGNYYFVSLKED